MPNIIEELSIEVNSVEQTAPNERMSQDSSTQNTTHDTTQQLCESIKELINETCQPKIDKEATKIKKSLINIWDKKKIPIGGTNFGYKSEMKTLQKYMNNGGIKHPLFYRRNYKCIL